MKKKHVALSGLALFCLIFAVTLAYALPLLAHGTVAVAPSTDYDFEQDMSLAIGPTPGIACEDPEPWTVGWPVPEGCVVNIECDTHEDCCASCSIAVHAGCRNGLCAFDY